MLNSYKLINLKMSTELIQLPLPLPEALRPWLALNAEFYVIICHCAGCQHALSPGMINRHLRDKHQTRVEVRKSLELYLEQWQWQYDFRSVPLPLDGSLPQPVLLIIDGFQCKDCKYKTTNRSVIRQHCNTKHNKKRLQDEELFRAVQLQTWFGEKRARYWVVDASGESRDVNNAQGGGSGSDDEESRDVGAAIKAEIEEWIKKEGAYALIQSTKPQSLAAGMNDSPVGLAAWMIEKFRAWSDCDGDIESRFTKDELLTQIMVYWATQSIATSFLPYFDYANASGLTWIKEGIKGWTGSSKVPAAFALFPKDISQPPREWAERFFNVQRWTTMPRGGHFAAMEEPELLAEDLRAWFRAFRSGQAGWSTQRLAS